MERIKITPNEFWVKDSSGNKTFDTNNNYLKTDSAGVFKVGGIQGVKVARMTSGNAYNDNSGYPCDYSRSTHDTTITVPHVDVLSRISWDETVLGAGPRIAVLGIIPTDINDRHPISVNGVEVSYLTLTQHIIAVEGSYGNIYPGMQYAFPEDVQDHLTTATNVIEVTLPTKAVGKINCDSRVVWTPNNDHDSTIVTNIDMYLRGSDNYNYLSEPTRIHVTKAPYSLNLNIT